MELQIIMYFIAILILFSGIRENQSYAINSIDDKIPVQSNVQGNTEKSSVIDELVDNMETDTFETTTNHNTINKENKSLFNVVLGHIFNSKVFLPFYASIFQFNY